MSSDNASCVHFCCTDSERLAPATCNESVTRHVGFHRSVSSNPLQTASKVHIEFLTTPNPHIIRAMHATTIVQNCQMARNVQTHVSVSQIHRFLQTMHRSLAHAAQRLTICINTGIGHYSLTILISFITFIQLHMEYHPK